MDTVFSKIISGEIPAEKLYEDEHCMVIPDINPAAPVHVLVIPKKPLAMLSDADEDDQLLLGHHSDDVAETIFMRILRGTGLDLSLIHI